MNKLSFFLISLLTAFTFAACNDGSAFQDDIVVSTPEVTETTGFSLTLTSSLSGDEENVVKRGFCYSVNTQNPNIKDNVVDADENFTATISGLKGNTTYYIRAYIYGNSKYVYSEAISAKTDMQSLDEELEGYVPPVYPDDYTPMAAWERRNEWNLANVHDPTVFKAEDGYFYMYQTDASYGNAHDGHGHFHCRRSKDLVNWEYLGATMQDVPSWVLEKLTEYRKEMGVNQGTELLQDPVYGCWAPVARKVRDGLYRMYYSIVVDNYIKTGKRNIPENFDNSWTERAFIGLMETSDPASNEWIDKGMVICSSSDRAANGWGRNGTGDWEGYFYFNAIDPTYFMSPDGGHWLIYGSWHSGFGAVELNPATGMPKTQLGEPWSISDWNIDTYGKLVARRNFSRWQSSEGPDVIYNPETGYYYMFIAYGQLSVAYNTRVVRSKNPAGPYEDMKGNLATSGQDMYPAITAPYRFNNSYGWVGISHCGIFDDGNGNWFYTSQGRFPHNVGGNAYSNAIMMGHVRSILWTEDGWPVVMPERYGAVPQVKISQSELVGDWELIQFKPGVDDSSWDGSAIQYGSKIVTLAEDGSVKSDAWGNNVKWSFDAENNIVLIGNNKIYIQREVDWELNPRSVTIVGGGYENQGSTTNWMKKTN